MHSRIPAIVAAIALLVAAPAQAHFVWTAIEKDDQGRPTARLWFSELAEPGEAHLIDRVAHAKGWVRSAEGRKELKFIKPTDDADELVAQLPDPQAKDRSVEVDCLYGVFTRGEKPILLHYFAKHLEANPNTLERLGRSPELGLDLVPRWTDEGLALTVLRNGKPVAGSEVVALDPDLSQTDLTTDERGRVLLKSPAPGTWSIRARAVEEQPGEHDGTKYEEVRRYVTLALRVPESVSPTDSSGSLSAPELLDKARSARAIWEDFPGFTADVTINADGRTQQGRVEVTADGEVKLHDVQPPQEYAVERTLQSLVSHRLSDTGFTEDVSFAEEEGLHPLGRLIKLDYDDAMASAYRVEGDVIRQVNRQMDGGRFTISVFDVHRNPEGKYLPRFYTVNFWNADGSLRSSTTTRDTWTRVGDYDLPKTHSSVTAGKDAHRTLTIEFRNHRLANSAE